jgi:microcystin-dependent protein
VPVEFPSADVDFNAAEKTGGEKAVTLTAGQVPLHTHSGTTATENANHTHSGSTAGEGGHQHAFGMTSKYWADVSRSGSTTVVSQVNGTPPSASGNVGNAIIGVTNIDGNHGHNFGTGTESTAHAHTFTTDGFGGGGAHNNMSPYITCYMWKRLPDPPT